MIQAIRLSPHWLKKLKEWWDGKFGTGHQEALPFHPSCWSHLTLRPRALVWAKLNMDRDPNSNSARWSLSRWRDRGRWAEVLANMSNSSSFIYVPTPYPLNVPIPKMSWTDLWRLLNSTGRFEEGLFFENGCLKRQDACRSRPPRLSTYSLPTFVRRRV